MAPRRDTRLPEDLDIRELLEVIWRSIWPILAGAALLTAAAYAVVKLRPAQYAATASLITGESGYVNALITNSVTTPPTLPPAALALALNSASVVSDINARLKRSGLPADTLRAITTDLNDELGEGQSSRFKIKTPASADAGGIYEIQALAETPQAAQALASAGVDAILAWDQNRSQRGIVQAQSALRQQIEALTQQLTQTQPGSPEQARLRQTQSDVRQALTRIESLQNTTGGSLGLLAQPVLPRQPIGPPAALIALIVAVLSVLLGTGFALLRQLLVPRVYGAADLGPLQVPLLGQLPTVSANPQASTPAAWHRQLGFLGLNLLTAAQHPARARLLVAPAAPGAGSSRVCAGLAASLGQHGYRTLLIETDLNVPAQTQFWTGPQPAPSSIAGVAAPGGVLNVAPNVTLLPAAGVAALPRRPGMAWEQHLSTFLLGAWARNFDLVLIDAPDLSSAPEIGVLAAQCDGTLLVVAAGTRLSQVAEAVQAAELTQAKVLGTVLNKAGTARRAARRLPLPATPAPEPVPESVPAPTRMAELDLADGD